MVDVVVAGVWLIGLVFIAAGVLKLREPRAFERELGDYRVLPRAALRPVALVLPGVEVVCGIAIVVPALSRTSAAVLLACLILFSGAVVVNLARGVTNISCACFGRLKRSLDWWIPARNAVMAGCLVLYLAVDPDAATRVPGPSGLVIVTLGVLIGWTLWHARALSTPIGGSS